MGEAATRIAELPWERGVPAAPDRLARQADEILARCRGEGPANCVGRCPLHVDARGYAQLTSQGRYREALQLVRDKLPFPGVLGYLCAHPCELHCKRIDEDSSIRIRDIKRFLADWEPGEPQHILDRASQQPGKAAVIGAGPAGLMAAHDLSRAGYDVTLFDREAQIGGCLVQKIPDWRLPRKVVERDLSVIEALDIEVRTGVSVGRDVGFDELREEFQTVLLLCGYEGGLSLLRGNGDGFARTIRDTLWVDPLTCETGVPGAFAGGDAVSGPSTVIHAMALGRRAAESARRHMAGEDLREGRESPLPQRILWTLEIDEQERQRRERAPVMLQPFSEALDEGAARLEAARCLDCECGLCVKDCEFLAKHCRSPKDLARRVRDGAHDDDDALKMAYSCNICSLCETVCPENLDTGALLLEARCRAVEGGKGPLPQHKPIVSYFNAGVSKTFCMVMPEPGRSRSKRLFFTGCALPAVAPGHTLRIYDELRKHYRGTGVLMRCCGAPVELMGMDEAFTKAKDEMLRMIDSVGAEELVAACPDCAHTLKENIPEIKVTTIWEDLAGKWQPPTLREGAAISIHDSCKARHEPGIHRAVRQLLEAGGGKVEDVDYAGELARCCGFGGMIYPVDSDLSQRVSRRRGDESSLPMITYCAGCRMALAGCGKEAIHILDFLLSADWRKATVAKPPGSLPRYANRLRTKWAFKTTTARGEVTMASPESITITVNGKETSVRPGTMLIRLLRDLGIVVPTLCHDERLTPYGGCRLCVVARRDGRGGLVPACSTPAQRDMVIETDSPEVIESRRQQLQLLVLNHRMECPVCDRSGDCRFQDLIYEYGSPEDPLPFERMRAPRDLKSRVIVRDPEKCIVCGKCVRICDEIQGVAAIGIIDRGFDARVSTLLERPLDCEFCGQCVNACPVGALVARPYVSSVPVWQRTAATTTCSYCSCGCQIGVETHDGTSLRVTSDESSLPNHGKLCAKGWLGWDVLGGPERVETPLLRRDGRLVPVGWNEALDAVANAVREAREASRAIVGLGSSRLTCEDAYLMQRFLRSVAGSPHVDVGPTGGVDALTDGIGRVTGSPCSTATLERMAAAELVLVLRGDPTRTHPLVKTELVQGARQRGQKLFLAHALSGGLERHAAMYLALEPGTEEVLLHGLAARLLLDRPGAGESRRDVVGFDEWSSAVAAYTPEVVASRTGIPSGRIEEMARALLEARSVVTVVVTGLGIPGDEAGVTRAAAWLMNLLDGDADGGLMVLGEKANAQGAVDVGLHPGLLPGHRSATDDGARQELREVWGVEPPSVPGWTTREAFAAAVRGEVGLLHVVAEDPLSAWPQCYDALKAIDGAGFVVVQDAFLTRTARQADVVLPVHILGDREGTLVGADGIRRQLRRVRTPPLPLPQDGQIFVELARRLGAELPQGEQLESEIGRLVGWPHGAAAVERFEAVGPPAEPRSRSGMLLDVSPQLFHSGSVTRRSQLLQELAPTVAARLSPADAREMGVENGETIRVVADERELLLRARIDRTVRPGTLLVPWASGAGDGAASLITEPGSLVTANVRRSG